MQPLTPTFSEAFKANPFFFMVSTALAAAAFVLAVIALAFLWKKPIVTVVLAGLALLGSLAAFGFGTLGWTLAVSRVDAAASYPGLTDADRDRLTHYGYAEARICLVHGALVSVVPFVAGVGLAFAGVKRRKRVASG